jgi:hypothetical protein
MQPCPTKFVNNVIRYTAKTIRISFHLRAKFARTSLVSETLYHYDVSKLYDRDILSNLNEKSSIVTFLLYFITMNKLLISILCICLILLTRPSLAIGKCIHEHCTTRVEIDLCVIKVRTEEITEWTKDSLGNYFNKYRIVYDKKQDHKSLADIAQSYKEAAAANAKYFGEGVDSIVSGFADSLSKHSHLARNDVAGFLTNLKHELRQLELKGQLTKDRIEAVLDKAHREAIRQKIMTEAEWKKAYTHFESRYQPPPWYQRVLGARPVVDDGASTFNLWAKSITSRISHFGDLTKEQIKDIEEQVRESILNTDIHRLGDKVWLEDLSDSISAKTQLKKDQLEEIINSISKDINGYKIFALEYTGQAREHAKNWMEQFKNYWEEVWDQIVVAYKRLEHRVRHVLNVKKPKQVAKKATASVKSVASSLSEDWHSSSKSMARSRTIHSAMSKASSVAVHATEKIQNFDLKDSFGHFWRQKEHDAYRRLGYTEAHIDWIQSYLEKALKDQKTAVKGRADEVAIAIKRYLDDLGIQSPAQVDQNVHKLKRHMESWRTLVQ